MGYLLAFLLFLAAAGFISTGRVYEIYSGVVRIIILLVLVALALAYCNR